jgi:hypothetical protein
LLARAKTATEAPPLWDGRAAERVADVLLGAGRAAALTAG